MTLTFIPSLQHLAAVKVTLATYDDDTSQLLNELVEKHGQIECYNLNKHYHRACDLIHINNKQNEEFFYEEQKEWLKKRNKKARKKLAKHLPKLLRDRVFDTLQGLATEIYFWVRDHLYVLKHIETSRCKVTLCWKPEGTIDREKMARQIVENEIIDKRDRFAVACIYFWENDIWHLWTSMTAAEREGIICINSNVAVQFWVTWLRKRARPSWTEFLSTYIENEAPEIDYNRVRLISFFNELNPVSQRAFCRDLWSYYVHADDFRQCYNLLDETGRREIFHSNLLTYQLLCCYLNWPLQSLFLDAVNQMRSHLTVIDFMDLLHDLVFRKLMGGVQDFDYLQLLKDLWGMIPDPDKMEIQKASIFILVQAAISFDEKIHPLPIHKLLRRCHEFMFEVVRQKIRGFL